MARRFLALSASCVFAASASFAAHAQSLPSSSARTFLAQHPTLKIPAQANRVAANASLNVLSRVEGHVAPFAKNAVQVGAPNAGATLHLTAVLSRSPDVQAAFDQLLADQRNPNSAMYHQWLTPQQLGELYGPTQADVNAVTQWLENSGFTVESIEPNRMRVNFTTTFGAAASVFQTNFADFTVRDRTLFSVIREPSMPLALTGVLTSVTGLSQIPVYKHSARANDVSVASVMASGSNGYKADFTNGTDGSHYLAPGDFDTIYDVTSVKNAGYTGTGQRIAIVGQSRITAADLTNYESLFGLPNTTVNTVIPTNGKDPGIATDTDEQTLDVERAIGVAPGATIDLVVSGDTTTNSGLNVALNWNVNNLLDKIMSISYGTCEADYSQADASANDSFFAFAAAEGITTIASSGDTGAQGCVGIDTKYQNGAYISGLCASSYVTCVGGTEFNEGTSTNYWSSTTSSTGTSVLGYIPEGAWNDPSNTSSSGKTVYQQASTGGGLSLYIAKPQWQSTIGVPADGKRDVPDISFTSSANHDGYLICLSPSTNCAKGGSIAVFGGTSAAAPGMAGIMALFNQRTSNTSGSGNVNPLLYKLAASNPNAFHDTTVATSGVTTCSATIPSMCNNTVPGSTTSLSGGATGYLVTNGYDLATGLGSLDVANFISAAAGLGKTFLIAPSQGPLTIPPGTSTTSVLTLNALNGFTGTVALACALTPVSGTASGTCSVSPGTITLNGGTATGTLTIAATANTSGVASAVITGVSGTTVVTSPTVSAYIANYTLSSSATSLSISGGSTSGNTAQINITSSGPTAPIGLSCLVTGGSSSAVVPSCALSSSSITFPASGTQTSTATISTKGTTTTCTTTTSATLSWKLGGSFTAFALLLVPFRRRKSIQAVLTISLLVFGLTWLTGCGGSSGGGQVTMPCTTTTTAGTTAGTYIVTIAGVSGGSSKTITFNVTVN